MADEGNERGTRRMDLNLYLCLPRSPRRQSLDLGSDLSLSSLPLSSSSATEDSPALVGMSRSVEPTASHAPYSPSHASISPEPSNPSIYPIPIADANSSQEYTPYIPSYQQYEPLYSSIPSIMLEGETSSVDPLRTPQETGEQVREEPNERLYDPLLPSYFPLDPQDMNDEQLPVPPLRSLRPYSSSMYSPVPSCIRSLPSPPPLFAPSRLPGLYGGEDDSSSRSHRFESPEFRFRRLIESSRRLRRFRSSLPYQGRERPDFARSTPPSAEQLMIDTRSSGQSSRTTGKLKVPPRGIMEDCPDEEKEKEKISAADFECNVCFDMAKEPVVTSCGHLFCWPCLYQWLNVHSVHKECPVCKGEVTEANITPIYGRGNSESSDGKKLAEDGESNMKIPPRPHGIRLESLRQQLPPISRRFREGLSSSWRRLMHREMRSSRNRLEDAHQVHHHAVFTRPRSLLMEELNAEIGGDAEWTRLLRDRDSARIPQRSDTSYLFHDRDDLLPQFSMYGPYDNDRSPYMAADTVGMFGTTNRYEASTSYANFLSPEQLIPRVNVASTSAADQASVSSTAAVIQGDLGFTDGSAEPNDVGSSRSYRRRGRSSISGSLDVDGGFLHACKRRRLN